MGDIRLLLADVDGTLVTDDKALTDRAISAVHRLHDAGVIFALTSGRPPRGMAMLVEPLTLQGPIAAFNGGLIVTPDMSTIEQKTLPAELVPEIIATVCASIDAWVYQGADWFVTDPNAPHVEREAHTVQFGPTVVDSLGTITEAVAKITGVGDDHELVARISQDLGSRFGDHVAASRSQPYYVDVTHPEANKGGVVAYLSEYYDIDPAQIATIGDMPNDIAMFAPAGLSIAMGQSDDAVRAAADRVTASNAEEGFARAVEEYIL
ncbi:MAG TPA: Cof-type HAD-IIB family hydrolase [Solirubrobacteraceae bacterium]|nr:Cof-type HAD-IIB family hydrolase [Solirubrobacteraceae bacterium]